MGLVRAFNSGISGLRAHQTRIDVVGDNLANSDTTGFKSARVDFQTILSQTLSSGAPPAGNLGGVDPLQIGLGVSVGSTPKNFAQGALKATGVNTDLAVEGDGFFVLGDTNGNQVFSRDGTFSLNPQNQLHDPATGFRVRGWNANLSTFQINSGGPVESITIPVGTLRIAQETSAASFGGNLNSTGSLALNGTVLETTSPYTDVTGVPGNTADSATLLTNLGRTDPSGTVDLLLDPGDTITVSAMKGGKLLPTKTFGVGPGAPPRVDASGTTYGQFVTFLQQSLGITPDGFSSQLLQSAERTEGTVDLASGDSVDPLTSTLIDTGADYVATGVQVGDILRFNTGPGAGQAVRVTGVLSSTTLTFAALDPSQGTPGAVPGGDAYSIHEGANVSIGGPAAGQDAASPAGTVRISGNAGAASAISNLDITVHDAAGPTRSFGLFRQLASASGESVSTSAVVFDSLGAQHIVENTYYLDFHTPTGTRWRWLAEAEDNTGPVRSVGTGTVNYDLTGKFASDSASTPASIDLDTSGVTTPLDIALNHSRTTGFANRNSELALVDQDGFAQGTLNDFAVGADGVVKGLFSNGITRDIAQVALARFQDNNGLRSTGDNLFRIGAASGAALVGPPEQFARGAIRGGFLEDSNVDIAQQFTDLITSQRSFQANARTISVASQLLQELIQIV